MNKPPDFDDLMEGIERPEERERLRRVHELLVQAGPPPELSPALSTVSPPRSNRRRWLAGLALAAALAVAAFGVGYFAGDSGDESTLDVRQSVQLAGGGGASGVINLGYKGSDGNWPMVVTVRGLKHLSGGDYYRLALTRDGEAKVTCGTFNVGRGKTTIEMVAAYDLKGFDGWVVTLWDGETHDEKPVLWTAEDVSA